MSPFRIFFMFLVLGLAGVLFFKELSLSLEPTTVSNKLSIIFDFPDSSPEIIEHQVTSILENVFSQLSSLKNIYSESRYHSGAIHLEFDPSIDIDYKRFEISALIRQTFPKLPRGVSYPRIINNYSNTLKQSPLVSYVVRAPYHVAQIFEYSQQVIYPKISFIKGVQNVSISGATDKEIIIEYNYPLLISYQLTKENIIQAISAYTNNAELGVIENTSDRHRIFIRYKNTLKSAQQLQDITLRKGLKIRDVALVYERFQLPRSFFRINGENAIRVSVYGKNDQNRLVLAAYIKDKFKELQLSSPQGYEFTLDLDSTDSLQKELSKTYFRNGLSWAALLGLFLIIRRKKVYIFTLVLAVAINISLGLALAYIFNIEINIYSLAGLTVSLGMMIDNVIILLENFYHQRKEKVFIALLGAMLTTILSLGVIFLMPPTSQAIIYKNFSLIIIINLALSLLIAWWFVPACLQVFNSRTEKFYKKKHSQIKKYIKFHNAYLKLIMFLKRYIFVLNTSLVLAFGLPVFLLPEQMEGLGWYNRIWSNDVMQQEVKPLLYKWLGGALRMFLYDVYEGSTYRDLQRTRLLIEAEMPQGTPLDQMDQVVQNTEDFILAYKGIDKVISNVYSGQNAFIEIIFAPAHEQSSLPYQLKSRLTARALEWGGVNWSIYGVGQSFDNKNAEQIASFRVKIKGYNYNKVEQIAKQLAKSLESHQRIQKVNINQQLYYYEKSIEQPVFRFDNQKYTQYYNAELMKAIGQIVPFNMHSEDLLINIDQKHWRVSLRGGQQDFFSSHRLYHGALYLSEKNAITLRNLGKLEIENTTTTIHKENRQYIRVIGFDYFGTHHFGKQVLDSTLKEFTLQVPPGFNLKQQEYQYQPIIPKNQYKLFFVIATVIFIVCTVLFGNFRQSWIVLLSTPLSFIGVFLTFAWGGFYFDQGGYAGMFLLAGLVVNGSIYIINYFNNLSHNNFNKAVIRAITHKASSIMITTFSTVLGLVPFLIEGDKEVFWFSFALTTIAGLLFYLLVMFIVLPVWMVEKQKNKPRYTTK